MMDRWYGADDLRKSWCLLLLAAGKQHEQLYAQKWALGDGNAERLIETDQQAISEPNAETELLLSLGEELDERRYQDTTLVTPTQQTLKFLRARLLSNESISNPTLRGYRHIAVYNLIENHVDLSAIDTSVPLVGNNSLETTGADGVQWKGESGIERVWELMVQLTPLVPPEALQGTST